ncbi:MAG: hypothetical protein F2667_14840 [Actinobacteria bacterium]|uniref:Unannotated protein n=1 Tax=freshwater metagenome TaxID=449393 RepID=A0A6J6SJI4_9ZZZZ|nr:hypothetical protein [Actinomycetota bacterium]
MAMLRRALGALPFLAVVLVIVGAPTWLFLWGDARGWSDASPVTVTVPAHGVCRQGPPPENADTCRAGWQVGERLYRGEVSDRYGGSVPTGGGTVEARMVDSSSAFAVTGFHRPLLWLGLAAPWLVGGGCVLFVATYRLIPGRDPNAGRGFEREPAERFDR